VTRLLIAFYLLEAGALLIVAPWWGGYWERNRFAASLPLLADWMANTYVRGAVSGIGVVTALVGLWDLLALLFVRSPRSPQRSPEPPTP
jgi:hypothetical protein